MPIIRRVEVGNQVTDMQGLYAAANSKDMVEMAKQVEQALIRIQNTDRGVLNNPESLAV